MDTGLQKRHKYIWLFLAVIIPTLLILVIKDLDFNRNESANYTSEVEVNSDAQAKHDLMDISVTEKDGVKVLELYVKQPLKSASSVVFALDNNLEIGQLEGVGSYTFRLEGEIKGIIIKDVIKNQEILKLEF